MQKILEYDEVVLGLVVLTLLCSAIGIYSKYLMQTIAMKNKNIYGLINIE